MWMDRFLKKNKIFVTIQDAPPHIRISNTSCSFPAFDKVKNAHMGRGALLGSQCMELWRRVCYNFVVGDEETSTLLKFDVVDLEKPVWKELRESIEREGMVIYEEI